MKKPKTSTRYSEAIQRIFKSFAGNYRQLWLGGIPTQEALGLAAEDWQEALAGFDAEEIEAGRKSWIYNNRMPPTIYEFKELLERLKPKYTGPYVSNFDEEWDRKYSMAKCAIYWRKVEALPNGKIENREQYCQLMNEAEKEEAEYIAKMKAQQAQQTQQALEEPALFDETERGPEAMARTFAKIQQMAAEHMKTVNQS